MNHDLIQKAIDGDRESIEQVLLQSYQKIHRYVSCRIADRFERDDVSSEIVIIVFLKISTLKKPASFSGWLNRVMSNCCNRWYQKKSKFPIPIEDDKLEYRLANNRVENDNTYDDLYRQVAKLPIKQKQVIIDFYITNLKIKEISFCRGVPVGTVKRRLHDARKNLKQRLEK